MSKRLAKTVHISEVAGVDTGQTQRVTGRTLEEWETIFSARRAKSYKEGKFTLDRVFPIIGDSDGNPNTWLRHELARFVSYHGLTDGDLVLRQVSITRVMLQHPRYMPQRDAATCLCAVLNPHKYKGL